MTAALLAQESAISPLGWMAGCWEMQSGATTIEEQWMRPAGETMLGMSRLVRGGKTIFSEFMRIERRGNDFVYLARITPGQPGTPFKMTRATESEVIFENPDHDFPQRILYRKPPGGGLFARVDGIEKGKAKAQEYPMKNAACLH